jgi:DNA processing protein
MSPPIPPARLALALLLAHRDGGAAARRRAREVLADPDRAGDEVVAGAAAAAGVEEEVAVLGWRWIAAGDPEYPPGLTVLTDPPLGIFVRGAVPAAPAAAIVGSRRATTYGREVAEHFGRELAAAGVTVVSGMARGVDAAAHRGALAAGGPTVAVWGAGPDRVYPSEHASLAEEIAAAGALVTEYPPGSAPLPHHFPERNRLIAGLAHVVIVVEADERSGALVTARLALDEGREVMAVPGSVFSRLSAGPNGLLRSGAAPALSAADVLAVLGVAPIAASRDAEPELLAAIPAGESATVDHIAAVLHRTVAETLDALLRCELDGWVVREADGRYRRNAARAR